MAYRSIRLRKYTLIFDAYWLLKWWCHLYDHLFSHHCATTMRWGLQPRGLSNIKRTEPNFFAQKPSLFYDRDPSWLSLPISQCDLVTFYVISRNAIGGEGEQDDWICNIIESPKIWFDGYIFWCWSIWLNYSIFPITCRGLQIFINLRGMRGCILDLTCDGKPAGRGTRTHTPLWG